MHKIKISQILKYLLILIPFIYIMLLLIYPLSSLFILSFFDENGFTLSYLINVLTSSVYIEVIIRTLKISIIVTLFSLIICYPIAYLVYSMKSNRMKRVIIATILIPFWISLLVRTFSWIVILQNKGVINFILTKLKLIEEPLKLLFNTNSVIIGMVHVLYPFMFLSLYTVISRIDKSFIEAAKGLGARPVTSFLLITLPLSLPGVLAGSILVFVMSLGFFVTPALIGGAESTMVSMLIETYVNRTLNWNLASALSLVLFIFTFILIYTFYFIIRKQNIIKEVP